MELRLPLPLGEYCSNPGGGGIHFHNEQEVRIGVNQDWSGEKAFLKSQKASMAEGPEERDLDWFLRSDVRGELRRL